MADRQFTWQTIIDTSKASQEVERLRNFLRTSFSGVKIELFDPNTLSQSTQAAKAAAAQTIEAEKRVTIAAKAEAQERITAVRTESNVVTQAARAASATRIEQEKRSTAVLKAEIAERQRAIQLESRNASTAGGGGFNLGNAVMGGIAGYLTVQSAKQVFDYAQQIGTLSTQVNRTQKAFEVMSGSAQVAERRIRAIQSASGGTVNNLQAMEIANQATSLGLAKTAAEFTNLTRAARAVTFVSPVIHDVQSAISELGLAAANLSFRRLDQLGLNVTEVKARMEELKRANAELTDSQAFQSATIDVLLQKYGPLVDSTEAQASGVERLRVAWANFTQDLASGQIGEVVNKVLSLIADGINDVNNAINPDKLAEAQTQVAKLNEFMNLYNASIKRMQDAGTSGDGKGVAKAAAEAQGYILIMEGIAGQYNRLAEAAKKPLIDIDALKRGEIAYTDASVAAQKLDTQNQALANSSSSAAGSMTLVQAAALDGSEGLSILEAQAYATGRSLEYVKAASIGMNQITGQLAAIRQSAIAQLENTALQAIKAGGDPSKITSQYGAGVDKLFNMPLAMENTPEAMFGNKVTTQQALDQLTGDWNAIIKADKETTAAAKRASTAGTKAYDQAAQEMRSLLNSIVKVSQVTQEDIDNTKLGIYKPKPDEYLRRLRDEVANGKDYKDVSIEDAAAGLNKIGVDTVGKSKEAILKLFEEAFGNLSLFSDASNLSFLNDAAVQEQIDLQEKIKQGQKNLYKHFGVVATEAVSAAIGGAGFSSAGGGGATAEGAAPKVSIDSAALTAQSLSITATITKLELADGVAASPVTVSANITQYLESSTATKPTPLVTGAISKYEQLASAPVPIVAVGASITAYGERTDATKPIPTVQAGITKFLESSTAEKPTPTVDAAITRFLEVSTAEKPAPFVNARMVFSSTRVDFAADEAELVSTRLSAQIAPTIDMGAPGRLIMKPEDSAVIRVALGSAITPTVTPTLQTPSLVAIDKVRLDIQSALNAPLNSTRQLGNAGIQPGQQQGGIIQSYIDGIAGTLAVPENALRLMGVGAKMREIIDSGVTLQTESNVGMELITAIYSSVMAEQNISVIQGIGFTIYQIILAGIRNAMKSPNNTIGQEIVNGIASQVAEAAADATKDSP